MLDLRTGAFLTSSLNILRGITAAAIGDVAFASSTIGIWSSVLRDGRYLESGYLRITFISTESRKHGITFSSVAFARVRQAFSD
jgi:hypothetical protein